MMRHRLQPAPQSRSDSSNYSRAKRANRIIETFLDGLIGLAGFNLQDAECSISAFQHHILVMLAEDLDDIFRTVQERAAHCCGVRSIVKKSINLPIGKVMVVSKVAGPTKLRIRPHVN